MADIKLTAAHDLDLSTGDIQILRGRDETAQRLTIAYAIYKGEWFLDDRVGMPYTQTIFKKNPDLFLLRNLFRRMALLDPGIDSVEEVVLQYSSADRSLTVDIVARDLDGETLTFTAAPILDA